MFTVTWNSFEGSGDVAPTMTRRLSQSFCDQMWRPSQFFVLRGFNTVVLNFGVVLITHCVSPPFAEL